MKSLIVILGQARAANLTWASFNKNLLNHTSSDLALCIGNSSENCETNPFWTNAKYKWISKEYDDFGDGFEDLFENQEINQNWREILQVQDQWLGGVKGPAQHPGSAGILIYFRYYALKQILGLGLDKIYDRFILTRSDYIWISKHPSLSKMNPNFIWFPYGEFHGGLTDRHVVLSRNHLNPYLDLLSPIMFETSKLKEEMSKHLFHPEWNLEKYIYYTMARTGNEKNIRFFPFSMYSVREEDTLTRWSEGVYSEKFGYYLKYPDEYTRSIITSKFFTRNNETKILSNQLVMKLLLKILFKIYNRLRLTK